MLQDDSLIFDLGNDVYGEIKNILYNTQSASIKYDLDLYTDSKDKKLLSDQERQEYLDILSKRFKEYITSSLEQLLSLRSSK